MPMTMSSSIKLKSKQDTFKLAEFLAPILDAGDLICLYGNLGSGKTFFAAALAKALGVPDFVTSPSFILLNQYQGSKFPLYHLDLYRLKNEQEFWELGITDFIDKGIILIEWPELATKLLPETIQNLNLHFYFDGKNRTVDIDAKDKFAPYFIK
jgi:tRNA threonylcarbamoyladenosine biosynthesis protein TsaE